MLPLALESLDDKFKRTYSDSSGIVYVLATTSPHWNEQGQRWLTMHVARHLREISQPRELYAVGASGEWEHGDIAHISFDQFTTIVKTEDLVVLSVSHNCSRSASLRSTISRCLDYTAFAIDSNKVNYTYSPSDLEDISKAIALLSDSQSRINMLRILYARITGDLDGLNIANHRIYDHPSLFMGGHPQGLYVDAGAYDGSECKWLRSFLPSNSQVLGFELDSKNYNQYLSNNTDPLITYVNAGLWSSNSLARISGEGVGARVDISSTGLDEDGSILIALDSYYATNQISMPVVFVKMDIEGAEVNALLGAASLIKEFKPALAISVYHLPADLWSIPLLLNRINPGYKLYLAQHAPLLTEAVLYAC